MILKFLVFTAVLGLAQCGQLSVLHSPQSVQFRTTDYALPESQINDMIQSVFGIQGDYDWDGLMAGGFFDRPNALVLMTVGGLRDKSLNMTSIFSYDTIEDIAELSMQSVVTGLEDLSTDERPVLFINLMVDKRHRVHLESGGLLPRVTDLQLPISNKKIYIELNAVLKTLNTISSSFQSLKTDTPDLFHFHITGLEHIATRYGARSDQMTQAVTSLQDVINQVSNTFRRLYQDDVIVLLMSHRSSKHTGNPSPVARRLLQSTVSPVDFLVDLNLAPEFTWMYPVMFNISLWFMVTFALIVFGVGWCVWFTDPGRDGVIYRLTTHHIKTE